MFYGNSEIVDILAYLFDAYFLDETPLPRKENLENELSLAGFGENNVTQVFKWLEDLNQMRLTPLLEQPGHYHYRVYNTDEQLYLSQDAISLLIALEQASIISSWQREWIIEQATSLEIKSLDSAQLKWIALITLMHLPEGQEAASFLEDCLSEQFLVH